VTINGEKLSAWVTKEGTTGGEGCGGSGEDTEEEMAGVVLDPIGEDTEVEMAVLDLLERQTTQNFLPFSESFLETVRGQL